MPINDTEIEFSRTVKAGKRVYYIDIKRDRRGGHYLSVTESKRVQDATETSPAVYEKHKLFVYPEDLDPFISALNEAVAYARDNNRATLTRRTWEDRRDAYHRHPEGYGDEYIPSSAETFRTNLDV